MGKREREKHKGWILREKTEEGESKRGEGDEKEG